MAIKFNSVSLSSNDTSTYSIDDFNGVDYTTTPTLVSDTRAIDMCNYMPMGNSLVKRNGWTLLNDLNGLYLHNLWKFNDSYIFYTNKGLYKSSSLEKPLEEILPMENIDNPYSYGVIFENRLFLLLNNQYLIYDGNEIKNVKDVAYIPTVVIGIGSTESNLAPTTLEQYNLLSNSAYLQLIQNIPTIEDKVYKYDLSNYFVQKEINNITVENPDEIRGTIEVYPESKQVYVKTKLDDYYQDAIEVTYPSVKIENITITKDNQGQYKGLKYYDVTGEDVVDSSGSYVKEVDLVNYYKSKDAFYSPTTAGRNNYFCQVPSDLEIENKYNIQISEAKYFSRLNTTLLSYSTEYKDTIYATSNKQTYTIYPNARFREDDTGWYVLLSELNEYLLSQGYTKDSVVSNMQDKYVIVTDNYPHLRHYVLIRGEPIIYENVTANDFENGFVGWGISTTVSSYRATEEESREVTIITNSNKDIIKKVELESNLGFSLNEIRLRIDYTNLDENNKPITDKSIVEKMRFGIPYGSYGYTDRLFLAGNPDYKNMDIHSLETNDLENRWKDYTYFGDLTQQLFGSGDSAITGYGILNNGTMVIFKESRPSESNLYFRTYQMKQDSEGNYQEIFPIQKCGITIGSDVPNQVIHYGNDLLINTSRGIYRVDISTSTATQVYNAKEMSYTIRDNLGKQINNSSHTVYDGKLYICREDVNGDRKVYVADENRYLVMNNDRQYEWWVLDNIEADNLFVIDNSLFFSNQYGIFKFINNQFYDEYTEKILDSNVGGINISTGVFFNSVKRDLIISEEQKVLKDLNAELDVENAYKIFQQYTEISFGNELLFKIGVENYRLHTLNDHILILTFNKSDYDFETERLFYCLYKGFEIRSNSMSMIPDTFTFDLEDDKINVFINLSSNVSIENDLDGLYIVIPSNTRLGIKNLRTNEGYPLNKCEVSNYAWYYKGENDDDYLFIGNTNDTYFNTLDLKIGDYQLEDVEFMSGDSINQVVFYVKKPIISYWYSKYNDLGQTSYLKTATHMTFVPDTKRGGFTNVGYKTTKNETYYTTDSRTRRFNFNDVNFNDFVFTSDDFAHTYSSKRKIKNFSYMQIRMYSNGIEDSTIVSLAIRYKFTKNNKGVK